MTFSSLNLCAILLLLPLLPSAASAGNAMLRITCAEDSENADVYVNGAYKGSCPIDVSVPAGTLKIHAERKVDDRHERVQDQEIKLGEDVVKKVLVQLSAPVYSAEAKQKDAAEVQLKLKKAKNGNASDLYEAALLLIEGKNVPQDLKLAKDYLIRSANAGNPNAMYKLSAAKFHEGAVDPAAASNMWLTKAAEAGSADAALNVARSYYYGLSGFPIDQELARNWMQRSAERGKVEAMVDIGAVYAELKPEPDYPSALMWWRKAADLGSARAMFNMGVMYLKGRGVAPSKEIALEWMRKSATAGDQAAMDYVKKFGP
jgi:TPR repeat protein